MTFTRSPTKTLFLLSLLGMAYCRAMTENTSDVIHKEKGCEATFTEGQTAELTFLIAHEALAHHDFFAHLRRSDGTDIVICDRNSPVQCKTLDPRYRTNGTVNGGFVLVIPNVTRDFQDTYAFQAYATSQPEPRYECRLNVTGNSSGQCSAPKVNTGDTAVMTFVFSKDINTSSDEISVRRAAAPSEDILQCGRNSPLKCVSTSPQYSTDTSISNHSLTLRIPHVTKEFQDNYVLHVNVDNTKKPSIHCYLEVQGLSPEKTDCPTGKWKCSDTQCNFARGCCDERDDCGDSCDEAKGERECETDQWKCSNNQCIPARLRCNERGDCDDDSDEKKCPPKKKNGTKEGHTTTILIAVVVCLSLFMSFGLCFAIVYCLRKRKRSGRADKSGMALLSIDPDSTVDNYKGKRWYWSEANEKGDKLLVNHFWKNGPGAFLVRPNTINPANFVLVASFDGTVQHLTLVKAGKGFKCPSTGASFNTLCQVVEHYRQNTMTVAGRTWGKLLKPFAPAPEQDWYYGGLDTEYEKNVLLSSGCRNGSFLIADAFSDADAYYLIVHFEGKIHRFGIASNDDVLRMVDTDLSRKTLVEIVDYYTNTDIIIPAGRNVGKLSEPCPKKPDVQWFSETLTIDEEMKILQSRRKRPGSFLVSKGVTNPNNYVLAVYFADEIKRFTVEEESNGFKLQNSEKLFYSWYELVAYYQKHDIEIRGNIVGKLSTPLRKEPEESCYIGRKTRMEERDLLLAGTAASGDFLIRDGITDPEAYVLAVNLDGQIKHFDIYRENRGFRFCNKGNVHTTLRELVDFYKNNEIKVGEITFGKLVKEVKKVTKGQAINATE